MGGYASQIVFPPEISHMENGEFKSVVSRSVDRTVNPLVGHGVYVEGNMENISETIRLTFLRTLTSLKMSSLEKSSLKMRFVSI
jgi:hypothetical protein